jgi:hypothetical protein
MKLNKLITTAALVMAATPAFAANWVYIETSDTGTVFSYDANTIRRAGNLVTVWEKWDHSRDKTFRERQRMIRSRYQCEERTVTTLNSTTYSPNGRSETFNPEEYQQPKTQIIPGSMAAFVLEAVCAATAP